MLRRIPFVKYLLILIDITSIWLAAFFAVWLRYKSDIYYTATDFDFRKLLLLIVAASIVLPIIFKARSLYRTSIFSKGFEQASILARSLFYVFLAIVLILFYIRGEFIEHSRFIVTFFFVVLFILLVVNRIYLFRRVAYPYLQESTLFQNRVLIIGAGEAGQKRLTDLHHHSRENRVVGLIDDDPNKRSLTLFGIGVLGGIADLESVLARHKVDEIMIAINSIDYSKMIKLFEQCKNTGKRISIASRHFEVISKEAVKNESDILSSTTFNFVDFPGYKVFIKNIADRLLSSIIILLFSPIWIIIAAMIKLTSKGPVFYKTHVVGQGGRDFVWYKFRTMTHNNDDGAHRKHVQEIIANGGSGEKLKNDPRITRIGAFLRKYSLDEFPQLINVLKGQMSLVGPRPCLPYEYAAYKNWHKKRFKVIPGLTGLWQVFGRNKVTFNEMVILDIYYAENYSIWLDVQILFNTAKVVFTGKGGV